MIGLIGAEAARERPRPEHRRLPRCWLVHGFNVRDGGAGTVDRLAPYFERRGYVAADFDYGWLWNGLLGVRFGNGRRAKALAAKIQPGDLAVGHSNGCALIHLACKDHGAPLKWAAYVNPALDRDTEPAPQLEELHVWHTAKDQAVRVARWLPWHAWGAMGAHGYSGTDPRVRNWDMLNGWPSCAVDGHSEVFHPQKLPFFGPKIAGKARRPKVQLS